MSEWINFKALRRDLNFEKVLAGYGVVPNIRDTEHGRQHTGPCPLKACKDRKPKPTFSANVDRGIWQCFSCKRKGNTLDFIILMEGLNPSNGEDVRKAAAIASERFVTKTEPKIISRGLSQWKAEAKSSEAPEIKTLVNEPLDFELKSLDQSHGWFEANGLSKKTVEHFGLGYCSKGWLKDRIAIPLHDNAGRLIGYAGRLLDESKATVENPIYLFPQVRVHKGIRHEFRCIKFLYHGHAIKQPVNRLFVVQKIEDVWWLWEHGYIYAVSSVGMQLSANQIAILGNCITCEGIIEIILMDDFTVNGIQ